MNPTTPPANPAPDPVPTPRSDEQEKFAGVVGYPQSVHVTFARTLERENTALSARVAGRSPQSHHAGGAGMSQSVHFQSKTDEWPTPQWLFDALNVEFAFTLDPCSTPENTKCRRHFTREDDGLAQSWEAETVWMNPPYGREIGRWMKKAHESASRGATVVCLVPARTDTQWWHAYAMKHEIRLLRGRLKFGDAVNSAPFPSALIIMRPPAHQITTQP